MPSGFGDLIRQMVYYARAEMVRLGCRVLSLDGLVLGMLRMTPMGEVRERLESLGIDYRDFFHFLEKECFGGSHADVSLSEVENDSKVTVLMESVRGHAVRLGKSATDMDVLFAILESPDRTATSHYLLEQQKRQPEEFIPSGDRWIDTLFFTPHRDESSEQNPHPDDQEPDMAERSAPVEIRLADYCTDMVEQARCGRLDPMVGRQHELERMIQILCRRTKNNPVLVGDPGVGKTALVEGLAQRIVSGHVPAPLRGAKLLMLDMSSVVAGTRYRGDFEERMQQIIRQIASDKSYIVFIDELHLVVGAGSAEGTLDGANILKPALSRGLFRCIGATTPKEYRQSIEADAALDRRFQRIALPETTPEDTLAILYALKPHYEAFHRVAYSDEALKACVRLTERYLHTRSFPDKAIDAMDETGARASLNAHGENAGSITPEPRGFPDKERGAWVPIDAQMVAETVSMIASLPLQRISQEEGKRLLALEKELEQHIVGQHEAIGLICRAIRRNRSGMKDPKRPVGTFLFLGSTGVGKTSLARALADALFDSAEHFVRVDMSEYNQAFSTSRLVGAPPGYVGFDAGGELTERVRRNPYSVVLFDEIEKAAPEVYNLLLQVLDEGRLTDSVGRTVDFTHTIIILTSNAGSRLAQEYGAGVGFMTTAREGSVSAHRRDIQQKALERHFPPEFLNRVDEVVYFRELTRDEMPSILDVHLRAVVERLSVRGLRFRLTAKAREHIVNEGFDRKYGARPLKRAIQRLVEDPVAELLLREQVQECDTVVINYSKQRGVHATLQRRVYPPAQTKDSTTIQVPVGGD